MASEKTEGIILRLVDFSESSCIVTWMTRDYGKITTMAKGARRPKSPFGAAIDVLSICRVVFLRKTSGAMSLLTEAKLERRFRSSATNLKRLYAGYYVIELLNLFTDEGDSNPELFDLAVKTIRLIDSSEIHDSQLNLSMLQFELKALNLLGHQPMLTKCVSCGREKTTLTSVKFGLNAGGILCQKCRPGQANVVNLSAGGLELLLSLVGGQIGSDRDNSDNWNLKGQDTKVREKLYGDNRFRIEGAKDTESDQAAIGLDDSSGKTQKELSEVRRLINSYVIHLLGFVPRLHKFLKNI